MQIAKCNIALSSAALALSKSTGQAARLEIPALENYVQMYARVCICASNKAPARGVGICDSGSRLIKISEQAARKISAAGAAEQTKTRSNRVRRRFLSADGGAERMTLLRRIPCGVSSEIGCPREEGQRFLSPCSDVEAFSPDQHPAKT